MARKAILNQLKEFKKSVIKDYPVQKMILFGSQAWGKPHRDSDIDLIIVSSQFKRKKSFKRGINLYHHWNLNYPVDFLCYTPEEFNRLKKQVTIVREAVEKGIEIK